MKEDFRNITGTFDILPVDYTADGVTIRSARAWLQVEATIREVFHRFNFEEIRTPILEPTELIARGIGELTDIVSKEMFAFRRGDRNYVMRPEITAPVMRAYLQHRLDQRGGAQKLFYIGPCFRAERPQKGRFRQFHQFGCEIIGSAEPLADAETIAAMMAIYQAFDVGETQLRINSLGEASSRSAYRSALRSYLEPYSSELSETSRSRLQTNPLRILDTKIEREREIIQGAPRLSEFLSTASLDHFDRVKGLLGDLGIAFQEDPFLVRGLDYYTHTAFELDSEYLGSQSALAGGGRYDLLAQELGSGSAVPAIGFAAGIERLFLALEVGEYQFPDEQGVDLFMVALGEEAQAWALRVSRQLRDAGMVVAVDMMGRSMKAQMREANRQNARYVMIAGERELAAAKVVLKEMETGTQGEISVDDIGPHLLKRPVTSV